MASRLVRRFVRSADRLPIGRGLVLIAVLASLLPTIAAPNPVTAAPVPGGGYSGVWTGSVSTTDAAALDDLGVGWARVTVDWSAVEPSSGTFVWAGLDQQLPTASGGGRRTVLALVRDAPAWAAATRCTLTSATERQQLATLMSALATRYKGVVWQLYNEEDNTVAAADAQYGLGGCFGTAVGGVPTSTGRVLYAQALEVASGAIRSADPTAQLATGGVASGNFISPSGGAFDQGFLPGVLAKLKYDGGLAALDYVTVHYYSSQQGTYVSAGTDLLGRLAQLRQDFLSAGILASELKPVISDELSFTDYSHGISNADPGNPFNLGQRAYVPKLLARAAAADVRAAFWFWMQDAAAGLGADNAYGLKDITGAQKPSYRALRYFNSRITRASQFVRRLDLSNLSTKLEGYEFTTPDGHMLQIMWNEADGAQVSYVPPGSIAAVTDPEGNPVVSSTSVSVGSQPLYITYTPVPIQLLPQPVRLVDTRLNSIYLGRGQPLRGYSTPTCYALAGMGGIPATASGVLLNVTTTDHPGDGYVTVYPAGASIPPTSNLNFAAFEYAVANSATVKFGTSGQVCAIGMPGAQLILDAVGYLPDVGTTGAVQLLSRPVRMVDTRAGSSYAGSGQPLNGYWTPNCYTLAGTPNGIPANAVGVLLNLTTTGHPAPGFLTVYPAGGATPATSNLNFIAPKYATANSATVKLGTNGQVCAIGLTGTHLVIDAVGYLAPVNGTQPVQLLNQPVRLVDTRPPSIYLGAGQPLQGYTTPNCYTLAGASGIPGNAAGLLLNLTTAEHPGDGYLTVYPLGGGIPPTSNVNFAAMEYAIANSAMVKVGTAGQVCAVGMPGAQLIIDAVGYLSP